MIEVSKPGHVKALDGIRALAIIMILIFHYRPAGFESLSGGFIGVDIFFVLSGYLITMLLLNEWQKSGRISLKKFWLMRFRRLLPAVLTLVLVMTLLAALVPVGKAQLETTSLVATAKYLPDFSGELLTIKSQALPAICYYINWNFIFAGKSYFELMDRPALFGHLWSLSIEEQFYLVWPLLLMAILFCCRGNKFWLTLMITALAGWSAYSLVVNGQAAPHDSRAYFGTDTRAYALMIGALLAVYFKPNFSIIKRSWSKTISIDALGLIGLSVIAYLGLNLVGGELFIFRGGLFLATLGTALLIISSLNAHSILLKSILSWSVFGWIGKRSYGLYLWHWPVFILTESHYNYPLDGGALLILRVVVLLAVVEISYRYIENPIRYGAIGKSWLKLKQTGGRQRMKLIGQFSLASVLLLALVSYSVLATAQAKPELIVAAKVETQAVEPVFVPADVLPSPITPAVSLPIEPVAIAVPVVVEPPPLVVAVAPEAVTMPEPPPAKAQAVASKVFAIGDSVMLGSRDALLKDISNIQVDAVVGRQFTDLEKIIANMKRGGKIPSSVFIHTGNNGTIEEPLFIQMMELLRDCERVVIFTVRVPRSWQNSNNEILTRVVPRYPNAVLVDWQKASSGKMEYFAKDGIHLRPPQGTSFYASLAKQALVKDS